jgi:uncharacterized membrane protein
MHICVATILAFLISGSWAVAVSIGLLEPLVQTVFFYIHERLWERIKCRMQPTSQWSMVRIGKH